MFVLSSSGEKIILVLLSTVHILSTTCVPAAAAMRHYKCLGFISNLHFVLPLLGNMYELLQIFNPTIFFCVRVSV